MYPWTIELEIVEAKDVFGKNQRPSGVQCRFNWGEERYKTSICSGNSPDWHENFTLGWNPEAPNAQMIIEVTISTADAYGRFNPIACVKMDARTLVPELLSDSWYPFQDLDETSFTGVPTDGTLRIKIRLTKDPTKPPMIPSEVLPMLMRHGSIEGLQIGRSLKGHSVGSSCNDNIPSLVLTENSHCDFGPTSTFGMSQVSPMNRTDIMPPPYMPTGMAGGAFYPPLCQQQPLLIQPVMMRGDAHSVTMSDSYPVAKASNYSGHQNLKPADPNKRNLTPSEVAMGLSRPAVSQYHKNKAPPVPYTYDTNPSQKVKVTAHTQELRNQQASFKTKAADFVKGLL